jgi:predicted  nucleic acid-binding Zn-ribbon protein
MDVLTSLTIIGVVTVLGETLIRVARARAKAPTNLQAQLDSVRQQLEEHSMALADQERHLGGQTSHLGEIQERLDFAERLLTKTSSESREGRP